jgi:hypothetical protein
MLWALGMLSTLRKTCHVIDKLSKYSLRRNFAVYAGSKILKESKIWKPGLVFIR